MNKFKLFFILLISGATLLSCSKGKEDSEIEPLRDYATQYARDKATIENFLNSHFITITENPGDVSDMDVKIDSIKDASIQLPIMSYKANVGTAIFPQLKSKTVTIYGVDHELYYLVLREGIGESPMNTDEILSSYSGSYLTDVAAKENYSAYVDSTPFEEVKYPQSFFDLTGVVLGWSETFPEFKTGDTPLNNTDGTVSYANFGAGVMFLPSALGYYTGSGTIPSYSPLVFSFKLYKINQLDKDKDGVLDRNEDLNGDGYVYDFRNTTLYPTPPATNPDDTDGDTIPDFLDIDDDGDGFTTKIEITKPTTEFGVVNGINFGPSKYYPYNPFTVADDSTTPNIDESLNTEPKGIPAFSASGEPDYSSSGRLRLHLDKEHHTPRP